MTDKLIIVNDNGAIHSLKGLFADGLFEILPFESPRAALDALEQNKDVALVMSYMTMKEMDGITFLERVAELSPFTMKILLLDETQSVRDFHDSGDKVFRIITQPWTEYDLQASVRNAVEFYRLRCDHANMRALAKKQFEKLTALNHSLEEKVSERAEVIKGLSHKLERGFLELMEMSQGILKVFDPLAGEHARRVTVISRALAKMMKLDPADAIQVELASLLHDIGKLSLPKYLVEKDVGQLSYGERVMVEETSVNGYKLLSSIERLKKVAVIVRARCENFDGSGFPDSLAGRDIPLGARIIRVANDYDDFTSRKNLSRNEAINRLNDQSSVEYDPDVVAAFIKMLDSFHIPTEKEVAISPDELEEGYVFSRKLILARGNDLVKKDTIADRAKVDELKRLDMEKPFTAKLFVYRFSLTKRAFTFPHDMGVLKGACNDDS